jgi:uncharacterized membrane protein
MKKQELIRNIGLATLPLCLAIFTAAWLLFGNPVIAGTLAVVVLAASIYNNFSNYFHEKKREASGVTRHRFKIKKVYQLVAPNDAAAPSLCFETQDGKCFLINGQWIYNEETYGEGAKKYYDADSDIFNCYNKPFSFPSSEFEVWVSNLDNKPYKIVILGDYMEPGETEWKTPGKYYYKSFAVINKEEL